MSQRIFITGGASGLGLALAHRFADSGASVCIGDIHTERGSEAEQALAAKATAKFLTCDVQRESDLQAAADWLLAEWGGVDVVINSLPNLLEAERTRPDVFEVVGTFGDPVYFSWAGRDDEESASINAFMDEQIQRLNEDGTLNELQEKWFGGPMDLPLELPAAE